MDNREPKQMAQFLRVMNSQYDLGFRVSIEFLEVCDYLVRGKESLIGNVGIERKTADDYVSSIMDGRLFRQIIEMHTNFNRVIVILEGDISRVRSKLQDHSKLGTLGSIITKYGTSIVHTINMEWSAYMIISILKHAQTTIDLTQIFKPKASNLDRELGAISCADGWGSKLAKEAIKQYRIRDIANMDDPIWLSSKIKMVGERKALNLINLFRGFESDDFITNIDCEVFKKYLSLILKDEQIINKMVAKLRRLI